MKYAFAVIIGLFIFAFAKVAKAEATSIERTKAAITWAFCGHSYKPCWLGNEAIVVAGCETGQTYSVWAENGQYKGLFQLGKKERERWGHGNNPWAQAAAAYRMYKETSTTEPGPRWHRWSCRPDGSVVY